MQDKKNTIAFNQNQGIQNEFICDNIFKASEPQPYADTTQAGKWGRGKDDSPVNEDEYPDRNNPLPQ